jgi:CRISPR/Cas system-associated protein Cas10 (large subunit of type III CRISPR-Cas system)
MEIVIFTHQGRYAGQVSYTGDSQPIRLQEMLNNPVMFAPGGMVPSSQIPLENVKIRFSAGQTVFHDERPLAFIYPKAVELAYETSHTLPSRSGLAVYERHHGNREEARVQILTTGQRRITGILPHSLRTLTHPAPDRSFFALVDVELEEFNPEPLTTRIDFILINYDRIESFIPVG